MLQSLGVTRLRCPPLCIWFDEAEDAQHGTPGGSGAQLPDLVLALCHEMLGDGGRRETSSEGVQQLRRLRAVCGEADQTVAQTNAQQRRLRS